MDSKIIGIYSYSTSTPGFNGTIKNDPESFTVEEIPGRISENENGKYTILKIRLYNWDTNKFLVHLANLLHISNKRISYAGTKDKIGITTQYFCINMPPGMNVNNINIKDATVLSVFKSDKMLRLGDLDGNKFTIKIQADGDYSELIQKTYDEIAYNGGFPNFYGYQRFGSIRINTHRIGKLLLENKYEDAVKLYLYDPEFDKEDYRKHFGETGDAAIAMKEYPEYLSFERSLLGYILKKKKYDGAFEVFPKNLSMLFIHAYQSYLFNRILSERMLRGRNMYEIFEGDLAYPVDKYFNADKRDAISANAYNLDKLNKLSSEGKIRPIIPLPGYDTVLSTGIEGEIERNIIDMEGITLNDFKLQNSKLGSSGDYRIISAMPLDFEISEINTVKFSLGKGIYATSLIREFLKN
ncbi:MAG: tRNA pseudouridine(13) synthase TruD [Ferroplasma sp.]